MYDAVDSILNSHYLLRDAVDLEIVNYSSLARKILPWVESLIGKKVSDESVLMALVRYSKKTKKPMKKENLKLLWQTSLKVSKL